jgi:hypothetical protein
MTQAHTCQSFFGDNETDMVKTMCVSVEQSDHSTKVNSDGDLVDSDDDEDCLIEKAMLTGLYVERHRASQSAPSSPAVSFIIA